MNDRLRNHRGIAVILAFYAAVSVLFGATIPIFESPDANGHYAYIHELASGRGLPVHGEPSGDRVTGYIAGHPPVYYALSAAFTFWIPADDFREWAWRNPLQAMGYPHSVHNKNYVIHTDQEDFPWRGTALVVHIARLVSTVLGGVTVLATYLIALELLPERRWLALAASAVTAFNPMFVFAGSRVSNDAAIACFGSLVLWGATRLAVRGLSYRGLVLTGMAWGLAILSKLSGTTLGPALALAILLDTARDPEFRIRDARSLVGYAPRVVRHAFLVFGTAALVAGWWFVRNLGLYDELIGVNAWLSRTATVRPDPIGFFDVIPQLEGLERSYWAIFGWFNIAVADWIYILFWWVTRLAMVGLIVRVLEQLTRRRWPRSTRWGLLILATGFAFTFGSVWRFIMIVLGAQGRYLISVVAPISIFFVLGLSRLVSRRLEPLLAVVVTLGLFLFAVVALVGYIQPAYAKPAALADSDLPDDLVRFNIHLGDSPIELIGGQVLTQGAHPGDTATVDIYWRAATRTEENYLAYIHLLGEDMTLIGNFDGYPGGGNYPTSLWRPGQIYRDRYRIPIASDAGAPAIVGLSVGLRDGEDWLTPFTKDGHPWPGTPLLDVFALRPKHPVSVKVSHTLHASLQNGVGGDRITLIGYEVTPSMVRPGVPFTLTLAWRADSAITRDYTIFAHLRDGENQTVFQADGPPRNGNYLTSFWAPGEEVIDQRTFHLPLDMSNGRYRVAVGLYHLDTGNRLVLPDGASEVVLPLEVMVQ